MRNRETVWLTDEEKDFVRSFLIEEDDDILAFNKPAGLPCQTRKTDDQTFDKLLWAFAKSNGKRPRMVHRLDAETSGIIIAAKTQPAAAALSRAFENREIKKTYLALVPGNAKRMTRVDSPIGMIRLEHGMQISGIGGQPNVKDVKPALTRFHTLAVQDGVSLIECRPETGRMHQIRIHLAHAGFPIFGDSIYGDGDNASRLMLHAHRIQGPHPIGGQFDYTAPAPPEFEGFVGGGHA
ncbi:MAG: RNA pseudouridine synthase [Ponticaulis sp.]|nr:RNA pseudouridine synthase [Ponticaulis sp.]